LSKHPITDGESGPISNSAYVSYNKATDEKIGLFPQLKAMAAKCTLSWLLNYHHLIFLQSAEGVR
jgi:hypothetical protein